jgi:hypothetical protein
MTILPILVMRVPAEISHNIAQVCQVAGSDNFENNTFAPIERAQRSAVTACKVAAVPQQVPYNRYFPADTQAAILWLRNRRRKHGAR